MKNNKLLITLFLFGLLLSTALSVKASTFTVSNLNNSGAGSLRQAIIDANSAGTGGHLINFSVSGVISITSHLPIITNNHVTIDGAGQSIVVSANGGDIGRWVFRGNAGADFLTIKNLEIKNTGVSAFRFDGSPTDVTIENIRWYNEYGNYYNYGIFFVGNAINLTVRNVIAEDQQNYGAVLEITGYATGLMVDNLTFDNTLSFQNSVEVIRIAGAATNCTIQNSNFNLDNGLSTNDGDYGIYFYNTVNDCVIKNVNILNCEVYGIYARLKVDGLDLSNVTITNGDGWGGSEGIHFNYPVYNLNMDTVVIDMNHTTSTNDGDYGIYFNYDAINVDIDSLEIHDGETHNMYIGRAATNFSMKRARLDNFNGSGTQQGLRFQGKTNNINLENVIIDGDVAGTTDDGNYGLLFISTNNVDVSLNNVNVNEYDVDGFYMFEIDNLLMDGCTASNNFDGMEYYGGYDRSNNVFKNCSFADNTRAGLVINNANVTNDFEIDSCTFSGNQYGVWLYSTGGVKQIKLTDNEFFDNSVSGIRNEQADGVLYARNNMWNNTVGIDNVANNGNNDLENADGDVPFLLSSVNVGGSNYEVTFTLPSFCNTSDCDVEFFTNNEGDVFLNGREYQAVFNNLGSGSNTVTVSSNGNTTGFWTATLKVATLNNSVSEFSDPLTIHPQFPAGVGNGIALWMSADKGVTENVGGNTITEWKDRAGVHTPTFYNSDPDLLDDEANLVNFNPTVNFDGNDYIRWDGDDFAEGFTSGEVFMMGKEASPIATNHVQLFDFGSSASAPWYTYNSLIYEAFGSADRKRWNPNNTGLAGGEGAADALISGQNRLTTDYQIYNVLSETNNWQAAFDGETQVTDNTNSVSFNQVGVPYIGGVYNNNGATGNISEIVLYNRVLDLNERQRINTYLAIKYGKTLVHNYYASDWNGTTGTTLWTIGGGYDNDIAGIGRDDEGSLFQNQSKSVNSDAIVTIYNEDKSAGFPKSNVLNIDTPTVDKSFILWGNNDSIADFGTPYTPNSFTLPVGAFFFHMERIWNVAETGTINDVTISIPASTGAEYLLIHNTDDFSSGTPDEYELLNDGNGNLYAVVDFDDGDFFTFGALRTAPGCVPLGLNLWLKPDLLPIGNAVNGIGWEDYSGNDNDFTAVASDPLVVSGGLNFNNYVAFDAGDYFSKASLTSGYTAGEVFSVLSANSFANDGHGFSFGGHSNTHYAYSNNAIYESFGTSDRIGWVPNTGVITDAHSGLTINTNSDVDLLDWNIYNVNSDLNQWQASFDGSLNAFTTVNTVNFSGVTNYIGRGNYHDSWIGNEAEVILYNRVLSVNERERVNTYLALKYGKTLYHDYLSGNSTMLWDSSALATYHNDIAGIGRDKCQGFYQRQSKSINEGVVVSIYNGNQMNSLPLTNAANTSTINTDNSFMIWGNNGNSSAYSNSHTLTSISSPCIYIMDRIWAVKETGTIGTVTVQGPEDAEYLLVHSTSSFGVGTIEIPLVNGRGTHDFSDGDYFTFGKLVTAPGGVIAGVGAWWRGDVGADASAWDDYSGNGHNAVSVGTVTPDLSAANYNPAMKFSSSYYNYTSTTPIFGTPNNYDNMYVFSVGIPINNQGLFIWGERANNSNDVRFYKNAINNLAGSAPYGYHMGGEFTGNNGVNNVPNLLSFQKTTTDMTTYIQGDTAQNQTGNYSSYYSTGAANFLGAVPGSPSTGGSGLSEVIIFKDASSLTATDIQQINSYLALKYGITISQTTPTDYIASDGTTKMWDATAGLLYNHDIAGIGRDDCSNLNQKQSKSVNQESLVAIGLGSIVEENANNAEVFAANKDFLTWGNDNAGTAIISTDLPASFTGCAVRLAQEWMVQENGSISNLAMEFGGDVFNVPNSATNFSIFIDTDGDADFTNGSPTIIAADSVSNDGIAYFSGLDLNDNDKFTFGWNMPAPGGVLATNQVNGVHYKYYKNTEYNVDKIESELTGEGYVANITNPDDIMLDEDADFTLELTTDLEITTAGNYTFRFVALDNYGSIEIDGVNYLNHVGACCPTIASSVVSLTAGKHKLVVRWSDIGSANTLNLQYNGPDNGTTWTAIPDDVLFVDPSLALWLKADGNVTNTGDGTTATGWKDESGKGNDVSTSEGVPLYYSSTATELLNFNPSINFQDDAMNGPDNLKGFAFDKQSRTSFVVASPSNLSGTGYLFCTGRDLASAMYGETNVNGAHYSTGHTNSISSSGFWTIGEPKLVTGKYENYNINTVNNSSIYSNGELVVQGNKNWRTQFNAGVDLVIGDIVDANQAWNGNIAEVIYYPWDLTTQEREQVESYLGMKYAITQAHDYFSSAGVLLWDSSAMDVYHNSIAAIARDDCQGLYQKQSKSVEDGTIVTMYNGNQAAGFPVSNAANTSTISADLSFMLYGHNDSSATYANLYTPHSFTVPIGSFFYTMERVWKVAETGTVGTVTVTIPANMRAEYLIVHNSDDFNTGTPTEIQLQDDGSGNLYAVLDLTDGQYFTFGFTQKAPGCVGSGLQLWLLPDDLPAGVLTSGWADNSFLLNDFTTVNNTPTLIENGLNFNNYVEFNAGDYLSKPSISSSFTAGEAFSMLQSNSVSTALGAGFHLGGGGAGSHYTWSNGAVYEFFGTDERLGWNPATGAIIDAKTGAAVVGSSVDVLDWNIYNVYSETANWATAFNGETQAFSNTNTVSFAGTANNYIGFNGANNWNGNNAETILYDRVLTSTERAQVNSYIALKYGITLHHDYLSGDGTILWDSSALATYHNDVAGIGREDCGGLHQKQSKSINSSAVIAIGNVKIEESNALNTNEILEDTTYLIWGHDNAGFDFQTTDMPSVGFSCGGRIAQEWKIQERGDINDVSMQFGGDAFSIPAIATNVHLFIDTDGNGDFTDGSPSIIEPDSVSNGIAYFSQIDFNDNDIFTIGWTQFAPGGIGTNNTLWLKANAQVFEDASITLIDTTGSNNVQEWHDVSGNPAFVGNHPTETAAGEKPSYVLNGANFNPSIYFGGGNDGLRTPTGIDADDLRDVDGQSSSVYIVGNTSSNTDQVFMDHSNAAGANFAISTRRFSLGQQNNVNYNTYVDDNFKLVTGTRSGSGFTQAYLDGVENGTVTSAETVHDNSILSVGINTINTYDLTGNISEIIIYRDGHTDAERVKVESYLGLKYGITVQHDYVSSSSTLLWDSSSLATYHNDVAGIGMDSCSGLFQKQSKSENDDAIVTMYHGDHVGLLPTLNSDNSEEFTDNNSFLIWGNNNLDTTYTGTYPTNTYIDIMERVWHVEETGTVGNITLTVDDASANVLIVDADGDFTDGNSVEYVFSNGEILHDFNDGEYFTFGTLICKEVATVTCPSSTNVDLTSYITAYTAGGTWTDESSSGVDISDPTDVDFSGAAVGSYSYKYIGLGNSCDIVNVERLVAIPAPIVDDVLVCEGGVTEITIPTPADREELIWEESFTGNTGFKIRSRCSGSNVSTCYVDHINSLSGFGLKLDPGIDFSSWRNGYWSYVRGGGARLQFARLRGVEISLTTDTSYTLLPGETMLFSAQSQRWWGRMEAGDYVKFLYVVDGVETEFASREGHISASIQTSQGSYTNNSGVPQEIEMRVKVKNNWNEAHRIDNFKITKVLAPPTFTFYDDDALTVVLGSGLSYDPMTIPGTTDSIYVTRSENGCESIADTVYVEVSPNSVEPMEGEEAFYCTGGNSIDLTAHISNYQAGGTWTDEDASGVDLSDPTSVDVSLLSDDSYDFRYELNGISPCNGEMAVVTVNIGLQPTPPIIDDINTCEGGSTIIALTPPEDEVEVLYNQTFNGYNGGYNLWSRCTSNDINSCRNSDLSKFTNRGLTVDTSATDFSKWTTWHTWVYDSGNLRFGRLMDEEIVLSTDSFTLLAGEVANFSGDSRRFFGTLEAGDYVKFFYVIDGVETEFASREGNISTAYSTSQGFYENNTALPVNVQLRVKVKNSYGEGHIVDNLKITKTLNKPINNFYSDADLTSLLTTGYSYDPATAAGTTDTVYVTNLLNSCESIADTVYVSVDTNDIDPMDGGEIFICDATSVDLTSAVTTYVTGGIWTDMDTSGANLADSTAVDFSSVANGSYNFSYKLTGSCADEEAIVTVHVGFLGGDPYVVADGVVSTALTECQDATWIYFVDPNDDSRRIAAINTNGNPISPSDFTVTVDVDAPATDLERASGTGSTGKAVELMRRQVQINCPACVNLSPAVDVRLYWESTEKSIAGVAMDALMAANSITGTKYWEWFKVSHDVADIPANLSSDGIADVSGTALAWSAPSSSGIESNGVEYVQFDGITDFSTFGGGWFVNQPDASILPVELVKLEANAIDNKFIEVNWETATEINNNGFELLRSTDGISFENIAWIEGAGNSNTNNYYKYEDLEVSSNTYYYRLNQIDFDGNATLSPIVSATLTKTSKDVFIASLSPNPTVNKSQIEIVTNKEQEVEIMIYDVLGRIVLTESLILKEGTNSSTIEVGNISSGMYSVLIIKEDKILDTIKWIVNSK